VAQVGVAPRLVEAALGLLQVVGEAADFGCEGRAGAAYLAEAARAHEDALLRVGPVDAPNLDGGIVEEAGGEVVLVEAVGLEGGGDLQVVDGEAQCVPDLAGREAGGGLEHGAVEGEVAVVIGEAEAAAIVAGDAPAPGEGGGGGVQVGL